jgi:hypothetical protein
MSSKSQIQNFREAARRHEADESDESFDKALGLIARHKPPKSDKPKQRKSSTAAKPPTSREE